MPGQRLRIKGDGLLGRGIKVYLDDLEITCCTGLDLSMHTDEVNQVTLSLTPMDIDIDADTLAALVALVDTRRKREHG